MPYPLSEQLDRNVLATLQSISPATGYQTTPTAKRATRPSLPPAKGLCILYVADDEAIGDSAAIGTETWSRPYGVVAYGQGDEGLAEPYDVYLNLLRADIEKAIMQDVNRGGLALRTILGSPVKVEDENEPPFVMVQFRVEYRTAYADPYTQA